ncbi:hypothetical protein CgunFtcFv8_005385 [Champsocephalus gunnari]|uniref:Core Histone H2A/H2B/H3 domain-containing protein n=1 Tax=Champsocephalus gunnari TaxID=52237 RepID=A0AAN8CXB7_CHAGU|nr:hypothetical protein CgunFtcFv8_005385 [Champsocephalus gunnari]
MKGPGVVGPNISDPEEHAHWTDLLWQPDFHSPSITVLCSCSCPPSKMNQAKRVTIMPKDIQLARRIRREGLD